MSHRGAQHRTHRRRDRRGRGMRGPAFAPFAADDRLVTDGLVPGGGGGTAGEAVPARRSPAEHFDDLALAVMAELWQRFPDELSAVQLGVEEVPLLPTTWSADSIPLCSYVEAEGGRPARLVLLRRPIEHRAEDRAELEALVLTVLVEQVAEILGRAPEDVHPDYPTD